MVDLPKVPRRFSTIEQTRTGLSGADIASPHRILAKTFDDISGTLEDASIPLAQEAGAASVRKGEDGGLVVDRSALPIVGKAGIAFERAAKQTYLARVTPDIETELTKIRLENPNDPDAVKRTGDEYANTVARNAEATGGAALGQAVRAVAEREVGQNFRSSVVEADRLNTSNALVSYKSRLTDLDNKAAALARQGGTDTDEYREIQADIQTLYGELQGDKRFKYPPERTAQELESMTSRHRGEAVVGEAMRIYDKATPQSAMEAKRFLNDAAFDPNLNLTTAERQQIVTRGMAALEGRTSENKAQVDANKMLVRETIEGLKTDAPFDDRQVNDLIERSATLGDADSYYKLTTYRAMHQWRQGIKGMPLRQQLTALETLRGGSMTATLVDRIVGAESGGDPSARAATSSAAGPGQIIKDTWLDLIKRNRPDLAEGKADDEILALRTPRDSSPAERQRALALGREMVGKYAQENRARLGDAGVRTDDGALYLAHFLGPGDAIKVLSAPANAPLRGMVKQASIDANQSIFTRNPTAGDLQAWATGKVGGAPNAARITVDAVRSEAVNDFRKRLAPIVENAISTMETGIGKGRAPTQPEISDIADGIRATGRDDLIPRVETALASYDQAQTAMSLPIGQRESFRSLLQKKAADGDPAARMVVDAAEETIRKTQTEMGDRPYSTGSNRQLHGTPAPLDFGNPEALAGAVQQRANMDRIHRNHDGTPARSVFEGQEGEAFKGAMAQGDAKTVSGTFTALRGLDDDQLAATMADKAMKDGIAGALRTTDPAKYNAVMSSLDQLYARAPTTFTKALGEEAWHQLKTWQTSLRYYDPATLAAERAKIADPQQSEQRKLVEAEARKEARGKTLDQVVAGFDVSWGVTPGFLARRTGSQPLPPVDAGTIDALRGDYETVFVRRYAETRNADAAHTETMELLKTKWARSDINGGKLMLRPPEQAYPAIAGSHDWMKSQIVGDLTTRLGPRFGATDPVGKALRIAGGALPGGMAPETPNWDFTIVSDRRTETEALSGKPASYQVVVTDYKTKKVDVVKGEDGKALRYQWNITPDLEKSRTNFEAERESMKILDEAKRQHSMSVLGLTEQSARAEPSGKGGGGEALAQIFRDLPRDVSMRVLGLTEQSLKNEMKDLPAEDRKRLQGRIASLKGAL